ncbi:MAG: response regulator [Bacteroidia bacterium]
MNMIHAGIADEHRLFRESLIAALKNAAPAVKFVLEAGNGRELINKMDAVVPEVLILGAQMPELDGFMTTSFLKKKHPKVKILVLSGRKDTGTVLRMVDLGVNCFLHKNTSTDQMARAIQNVIRNDYHITETMSTAMLNRLKHKTLKPGKSDLSQREIEVGKLICKEYTTREIADELGIGHRTVESHRQRLIEKSKVRNTAGLVLYLVRNGFV